MAGRPTFSLGSRNGLLIIAGTLLGLALLTYGAIEAYAGAGIPRGTVVGNTAIGGLSRERAEQLLTSALVRDADSRFRVRVADKSYTLRVVERAVMVDVAGTLDGIERARWNPITLLGLMRGEPVAPQVRVDEPALTEVVRGLSASTAIPAVDAGIDMSGDTPRVVPARAGLALDVPATVRAIVEAATEGVTDLTLTRVEQPAVISTLVAERAIAEIALPAIAESVTVNVTMDDGSLRRSEIAADTIRRALSFVVSGALLEPRLDGLVLRRDLDASVLDVQRFAKRAKFRVTGESITVVPSIEGYGISAESIANDVAKVIRRSGAAREVTLRMGPITPSFTTADAEALGITELVSSYTQEFPAAAYRTTNIGTAARYIQGTILKPGEIFSMNDTVKERTVENGYTEGWIVGPGGEFRMEQGGAVSTITTAMFNAAWFAGLKLVEHRAHSIYISRYRPGREATVSWGSLDMRFANNTEHAILITTKLRRTSISVYFWGTKVWPEIGSEFGPWTNQRPYPEIRSTDPACHDQDGQPGFRITVYRTFFDAEGNEVKREPYTTNYRPSPHVVCVSDSTPKPKPKPKPRPTVSPTPAPSGADTSTA